MDIVQGLVDDYIKDFRDQHNEELLWYAHFGTVEDIIDVAARARDPDNKCHEHQRRLELTALKKARLALLAIAKKLKAANTWDELYSLIEQAIAHIPGLGDLYLYDTTLRIGAWCELYPDRVYLHAGARKGAGILGIDTNAMTISLSELPNTFQVLSAHEAEDALCMISKIYQ